MSEVIDVKIHRARTHHWCDCCNSRIEKGQRYIRQWGLYEGKPMVWRCHELCYFISKVQMRDNPYWQGSEYLPSIDDFDQEDWQWLADNQPGLHLMFQAQHTGDRRR